MDTLNHGIAFAELVSYIEDVRMDNLVAPVFKLTDLVYTRLKQLGTDVVDVSTPLSSKTEYSVIFQTWKLTSKAEMWSSFPTKMLDLH